MEEKLEELCVLTVESRLRGFYLPPKGDLALDTYAKFLAHRDRIMNVANATRDFVKRLVGAVREGFVEAAVAGGGGGEGGSGGGGAKRAKK